MSAFIAFNRHLEENMEAYTLLMKAVKKSFFVSKTIAYLKEKIRLVIGQTNVRADKVELAAEYVTHGMFAAYCFWFNSDRAQSLNSFTSDVAKLVINGVPAYFMNE